LLVAVVQIRYSTRATMNDPQPVETSVDRDGSTRRPPGATWHKPLAFSLLVVAVGGVWWAFGDLITLDYLATKESQLRGFQADHPYLVYAAAFLIYVAVTGLSLPGAAALSLLFAWYFGFVRGMVLISFASTTGATIAFLLSRYFFRDAVQRRFASRLEGFNQNLQQDGAYYLLLLRLVPLVPFFVINLVMGLTALPARTFWWVSQLGMLPGTMLYVYAGSRVPSLHELSQNGVSAVLSPSQLLQIAIAFGLLGAFPLLVKRILARRGSNSLTHPID
jgi:uncharacterized membrane protein YdjX (TVP38/TMEM64 family)